MTYDGRGTGTMRIKQFLLATFAVALLAVAQARADEARPFREQESEGASLRYLDGIPVLTVEGTPEEIGRRHAELVKDVIPLLLDTPKRVLSGYGVNFDLVLPVASIAAKTMAARAPERYRRELEAAAKTAGVDANILYVANCLVELRRMGGCSAFVVTPDQSETGAMIFGRNFDFPTFDVLDKYSCVTIFRPKGFHAFASVTVPGFTGVLSGMNDAGLAIATLDVYASGDGSPIYNVEGAPLAWTYRQILEECATVDEARALLEKTSRTTYMNLVVCDREQAVVFELTPKAVGVRRPEGAILRCTNHFELPEFQADIRCLRYFTLGKLMEFKTGQKYSREDVHRVMHSVNQGEMTFQTMIFEPASMKLHVAFGPGPISSAPLHELPLGRLLSPGANGDSAAKSAPGDAGKP